MISPISKDQRDICHKASTHCSERRMEMPAKITMGRRQYPRTLMTQPIETPVMLIRFRMAYMETQPNKPTP